jgi:drug/metabolite transporter (DMT)-like permease
VNAGGRARPASIHDGAAGGRWLVFLATLLWGTSATLARYLFHDLRVPPFWVVELRLTLAVIVLLSWLAWRQPAALRVRREHLPDLFVLGLLGVTTVQGSYYYAISRLGVGLAILLQYLAPALIVIWALLRGERPRVATIAAVLSATCGTALLVGSVDARALHARPLDWGVGFAAAFFWAFYIVYSKRSLARYRTETVVAYTFTVAAVAWSFLVPPWRILQAGFPPRLWVMFFALGMFSTLVPFTLFNRGLRRLRPAEAGMMATLEPLIAVMSAWAFLGEGLTIRQWIGAAFVLTGALLATRQSPPAGATPPDVA